MRGLLDDREHEVGGRASGSCIRTVRTWPPPYQGKPKFLPRLRGMVDFAGGNVVHPCRPTWLSVNQSVWSLGSKSSPTELRTPCAKISRPVPILVHADDAAHPDLVELVVFGRGIDVVRLAQGDVRASCPARPGRRAPKWLKLSSSAGMRSPCLTIGGHRHVGILVEETRRPGTAGRGSARRSTNMPSREKQMPFGFLNSMGGRELLHLRRMTRAGAVGEGVDLVLSRAGRRSPRPGGRIAIIRASGTCAYRLILNPGGSLMFARVLLDIGCVGPHPAEPGPGAWRRWNGSPRACSWRSACCPWPRPRRPALAQQTLRPAPRPRRLPPPSR